MGNSLIQKIIDKIRRKNAILKVDWSKEELYVKNIKNAFKNSFRYDLDLKNPKTFSEKMQWLRVYDNSALKTRLADKYLVRDWVKEKIGEEYLVPLLGVYDNFDEINFDELPNEFVIKCNHGCGYNLVVKDKSTFDKQQAKAQIEEWLNEEFAYLFGEWHYREIKRKIIIEKYLEDLQGDITDYKYFAFNGKPAYILICFDRGSGTLKTVFYDMGWNKQEFVYTGDYYEGEVKKPQNFEKMTELATILAKDFKHVRVDFYNIEGKIYFGEMTFTSYGGYFDFRPREWDLKLGEMISL